MTYAATPNATPLRCSTGSDTGDHCLRLPSRRDVDPHGPRRQSMGGVGRGNRLFATAPDRCNGHEPWRRDGYLTEQTVTPRSSGHPTYWIGSFHRRAVGTPPLGEGMSR